jgi:hypothetical protein
MNQAANVGFGNLILSLNHMHVSHRGRLPSPIGC